MCLRPLFIQFFRFIIDGVPIAMNRVTTTSPTAAWGQLLWDPLRLSAMANEYAVDAWQRSILYADVRRQRGNQYQEHLQEQTPNVLDFASEVFNFCNFGTHLSGVALLKVSQFTNCRLVTLQFTRHPRELGAQLCDERL